MHDGFCLSSESGVVPLNSALVCGQCSHFSGYSIGYDRKPMPHHADHLLRHSRIIRLVVVRLCLILCAHLNVVYVARLQQKILFGFGCEVYCCCLNDHDGM